MSSLAPPRTSTRWRAVMAAIVLAGGLLVGCTSDDDPTSLTVMTRNLYLGADLNTVLQPSDDTPLLELIDQTWGAVLASDFATRAEAIADEIVASDVDVVGLQEAMRYRLGGDQPFELDFTQLLVDALATRGEDYRAVVVQDQFGGPFPTSSGIIELRDSDVILVRTSDDIVVDVTGSGQFDAALEVPNPLGGTIRIVRGWTSVELTVGGQAVVVVNTHLEAFDEQVRTAQATELLEGPLTSEIPVVLLGDLNSSTPDGPAYRQVLDDGGFSDVWAADDGATCCFPSDLRGEGSLDERIDLVLHRGGFTPRDAEVVGDEPGDRVATTVDPAGLLWPSDHAGVVARLDLPDS